MKKVGELACQMSSTLRSIQATVISCCAAPVVAGKGSQSPSVLYETVLSDSVLFPEGGGQPCDLGTVADVNAVNVVRRGDTCVIMTDGPLEVGREVAVTVDWDRRQDHMQHHSAQHVVTAVLEKELGLPTMSWALSHPTCYVQLPTAKIEESEVRRVEQHINELIAAGTTVNRLVYASRDELPQARSRGIPADVTGPIRLIEVEGVDTCTCCGTHVDSLAEIQLVKLLHQEPKGNTCRLHFVAGRRALAQFTTMYDTLRSLIKELGTNQEMLLTATQRRSSELTAANKKVKRLATELTPLVTETVAREAQSLPTGVPLCFLHEDLEMDSLTSIAERLRVTAPDRVAVLACGNGSDGAFVVVGPTEGVQSVAAQVTEQLEGKGGMTKAGFRGKCNLKKWKALVKALQSH